MNHSHEPICYKYINFVNYPFTSERLNPTKDQNPRETSSFGQQFRSIIDSHEALAFHVLTCELSVYHDYELYLTV